MSDIALVEKDGIPLVSSREVAAKFGKRHDDVLKAFRTLLVSGISEEFGARNFAESNYTNSQGKKHPEILMTKDGFMMLAMGFTGKEAILWKEKFLGAFNSLVNTVETLSSQVKELEGKLKRFEELPKRKAMRLVPVYDQVLPGFEDFKEPRYVLMPVEDLKEPDRSIVKMKHIERTISGLRSKYESLKKRIGL